MFKLSEQPSRTIFLNVTPTSTICKRVTGKTCEAGSVYPFEVPELPLGFWFGL